MGKRGIIIGIVVVVLALAIIGIVAATNNSSYYYEVGQYLEQRESLGNKNVRVNGTLVQFTENDNAATIVIADINDSSKTITVYYDEPIPQTMRNKDEELEVVAEGKFDPARNMLVANQLIMKCASKYEPAT